jgi:flagellar protein FlaH
MEGKVDITGALQQELQEEQPPAAEEEPEEEEERKRLIAVGVMDIDKRLGGGLPPESVTLVEGDPNAGKSVVIQQLALKEGFKVDVFLAESSARDFLQQMDSLGMSTTDYYLLRRLSLYQANLRVDRERADKILSHLLHHVEECDDRDLFIVDSITPLLFQFDEHYVLSFLANCKELASLGRTIITTLHSYAMNESLRLRASSIVDAHLRLRIEELGDQVVRTLEVAKIRGAAKTAKNTVSFTVQTGLGLKSVPISKTKA